MDTKIDALNIQLTKFKTHTLHDQLDLRSTIKIFLLKKIKNDFVTKRPFRKNEHIYVVIITEYPIRAIYTLVLPIVATIELRHLKHLNLLPCHNLHQRSLMHVETQRLMTTFLIQMIPHLLILENILVNLSPHTLTPKHLFNPTLPHLLHFLAHLAKAIF